MGFFILPVAGTSPAIFSRVDADPVKHTANDSVSFAQFGFVPPLSIVIEHGRELPPTELLNGLEFVCSEVVDGAKDLPVRDVNLKGELVFSSRLSTCGEQDDCHQWNQ